MNLHKWRTSSNKLKSLIPSELIEMKDLVLTTQDATPKALEVHWDVEKVKLYIFITTAITTKKVINRTMALDTATVFYIFGIFAPSLITTRVLLQSLSKLPLKWDDVMLDNILLQLYA